LAEDNEKNNRNFCAVAEQKSEEANYPQN